jgi:Rrf2 family nitric oxide-sensitive transcriptional repressor
VLGEVVRRTEPDMALMPCFDGAGAANTARTVCAIAPACRLRRALQQASAAFFAVLDGYTLADLTENGDVLRGLLELAPPPRAPEPRPLADAGAALEPVAAPRRKSGRACPRSPDRSLRGA